jgi:hypothetical protein
MRRIADIEALVHRAEKVLIKINAEYEKALNSKEITSDLRIDIKEYFGNLRSVLDYLAHDLVDRYCPTANLKNRLYFPICTDEIFFKNTMQKFYPELITNCRFAYQILEELQPFMKPENIWLAYFNKLNNENKHDKLVAQKRCETKRINVETKGGGSVNWDPSAVKFGSGVFIGRCSCKP